MLSESNLCLEAIQTILSAQLHSSATQPEKGPKKPPDERVLSYYYYIINASSQLLFCFFKESRSESLQRSDLPATSQESTVPLPRVQSSESRQSDADASLRIFAQNHLRILQRVRPGNISNFLSKIL